VRRAQESGPEIAAVDQARTGEPGADAARGVLVTGAPRSGTTWVGRMLALAPGTFYTHEPFNSEARTLFHRVLGPPLEPYIRYIPPGEDFPEVSRFLDYLLGRSDELLKADRSSWSAEERQLFRTVEKARSGGAAPVIKDPTAVLAMEWIHARYDIPVIAMVRHPAEFVRSVLRLGWNVAPASYLDQPDFVETLPAEMVAEVAAAAEGLGPLREAALMWKVINFHVDRVAERRPGIRIVRHEDLARSPVEGFASLGRWLGLNAQILARRVGPYCSAENPVEPEKHDDFRRNSAANVERWRDYFGEDDLNAIRTVVEPVSTLYGYTFDSSSPETTADGGLPAARHERRSGGRMLGREAIVILGMHRSGTSALAQMAHRCGAVAPATLMTPGPDNPSGFWESARLVGIADEVLAENGMTWDSIGRIPAAWFRTAAGRRLVGRYRDALVEEFPGEGPILLKDPRLCRLLPLVREACDQAGIEPRYVLTLRHPWEVVSSLQARNGCSAERGIALWLEHTLAAEHGTRGCRRAMVSYERLLRGWRDVASHLREAAGVELHADAAAAEDLDRQISDERRHHRVEAAGWNPGGALRRRADACHRAMLRLEAGEDPEATRVLDRLRREVAVVERLFLPIARDLDAATRSEREEREMTQRHLDHAEGVIGDLQEQVADRGALAAWNQELAAQIIQLERDLDAERDRLADEREEREAVQGHLEYAERIIRESVPALEEENRMLEDRAAQLDRALHEVMRSRSMRLTRPLRAVSRRVARFRTAIRGEVVSAARRGYHALPLPDGLRDAIRGVVRWSRAGSERKAREAEREATFLPRRIEPAGESARERFRRDADQVLDDFLASDERIELPRPGEAPTVSVVLVLHNQAALTLACLQALAGSEFRDFEVVIVDNASTDRTPELLERVRPCRVVRNAENLHFLRGCNEAAGHARGRYLLLLNNDTRVAPAAIGRALAVFEEEDRVGAVGGRLVLPDGTLQAAGSIIWSDGSCLGYGRGEDPLDPRFAFRRDVDYCSGAFLLTPLDLFERFGRFDERFAPAYYEETDYCLRLWESGYRVVFEPGVVVQHFEFGSAGAEKATDLSRRNQVRFHEKHRERLSSHLPADLANLTRARSARRDAPKVLVIEDRFPHRWLGSGFPRANHLIHEMVDAGCEVTLYATNQTHESWDEVYSDLPRTVECLSGDRKRGLRDLLLERRGSFDTIFVSRPHNMEAFDRVASLHPDAVAGARVVYDAEALFGLRDLARQEVRGAPPDEGARAAAIESEVGLARRADIVLAVSLAEARHFQRLPDREVLILGHCLEPRPGSPGFEERRDFLFVGAFSGDDDPNTDSVVWFAREVWPLVRRDPRMIGVALRVVGRDPGPRIRKLETRAAIEIVGTVEDTRPYYDRARVCIVPTRFAAGIPYKAHESAAAGVPMVTTDLIADQLGWSSEWELLAAPRSSPETFAEMCVRLYTDPSLWDRLRQRALERIVAECSREATRVVLHRALDLDPAPTDSTPARGRDTAMASN
jgi:GT2 family glycosyltransferase